jgi:hypothetical protein
MCLLPLMVLETHAIHIQRKPPPQDTHGQIPGDELAGIRHGAGKRGSLTVWFTQEAVAAWQAPATGKRGGQPIYSPPAIKTGLALRLVFRQPLRQTEGLLRSVAVELTMRSAISVPPMAAHSSGTSATPWAYSAF